MKRNRQKKSLISSPMSASRDNIVYLEKYQDRDMEKLYRYDRKANDTTPKKENSRLVARTESQKYHIQALRESIQTIAYGPAGVGKSYISVKIALQMLQNKEVDKIVLSRPNVSMSKSLGFFSGDKNEKLAGWLAELIGIIKEEIGESHFEYLLKKEIIELVPFELMRGRSFKNSFVIIDEFQSANVPEAKLIMTRIAEGSKLAIIGDTEQSDIKEYSGLSKIIDVLNAVSNKNIAIVQYTSNDIVRSEICKFWVENL